MSEALFYHFSKEGKLSHFATADAVLAAAKEGGFVWLHYYQTTKEELSKLIEPFGLHPLAIEDCFDENEIPKIEDYSRNTFILFNTFDYANGELSIHHIVQDDVHQEGGSVPGTLDVRLHDMLDAIQKPAIFGIALADGN